MNGTNSGTGSTWSQHSTTVGNTTIHEGQTNGNEWNMTSTAERLGIERSHLYRKLKAYGITAPK